MIGMSKGKFAIKNSQTPTELRLILDLNDLKTKRLTTKKFYIEYSNIIKDEEKYEYSFCTKLKKLETGECYIVCEYYQMNIIFELKTLNKPLRIIHYILNKKIEN